ncbi:MAG: Rieske (2Fe-2S) protein, partial [Chloroflexi bacterium]|nr:Rieske (2Fe-2S) protein [Chloroflexota bacterium]
IAVFAHDGSVYAVDNRCPHMGFPLDRGTVKDGLLTCHWHHARFDLSSGGTFDPFADDVRSFPITVVDGEVWVNPSPPESNPVERWSHRLHDGMEHNIRLVIAKAALGLNSAGADYKIPLRIGSEFGMTYSDEGWGQAMSILTCTANILPHLADEDRSRALYQGLRHVATECEGRPPRFVVDPLPTGETRPEVFKKWFRNFIEVRNDEGAERALRSAVEVGGSTGDLADMIFAAATDRIYIDSGHIVDFANKAFELLDHIGWEHSAQVLTSLVHGMATARRSEELNSWRNPIDISSMVWEARKQLPELYKQGKSKQGEWDDEIGLADVILEDDPAATLEAIKSAVRSGASPEQLGSAVAYAAFLRMSRFHTSNEFADWDTVHNTLTAANALHQALKRAPSVELLRAVFDTAMSIYLDRFLNVPSQRMPAPNGHHLDADAFGSQLLSQMDVQQQVEQSAQTVSDYLTGSENAEGVLAALGHAMLREDSGFHMFQIVDAGFKQYEGRKGTEAGRHVLVALSRFLAAHSPTSRSVDQTFQIAQRLNRGDELFREDEE